MESLLNIIIPVYNKKDYLEETLKSVISLPDTRIILVEDQSNDGSEHICRQYADQYRNVSVINGEHRGVSAARNLGLKAADGSYVCFLDADDYYDTDKLTGVLELLREESPELVLFDFVRFEDESRRIFSRESIDSEVSGKKKADVPFLSESMEHFLAFNVSNKIYKRSILEENRICFYEGISRLEDVTFFIQYYRVISEVRYRKEFIHYYRCNQKGSLLSGKQKDITFVLVFADAIEGLLEKFGKNRQLLKTVRKSVGLQVGTVLKQTDGLDEETVRKQIVRLRKQLPRGKTGLSVAQLRYYLALYMPGLLKRCYRFKNK